MSVINRRSASDLRGAVRLAVDATVGVTDLVEKMHHTIQGVHPPVGASRADKTSGITGLVYRSIRGTTRLVGKGLDASLAPAVALLPEAAATHSGRDAVIAAINGVYGDHLVQSGNPLATTMSFQYQGLPLADASADSVPSAAMQAISANKIMLFVHGLCLNETHWARDGVNRGEKLANDLEFAPLYLRYNTGLHIPENGHELAEMLENLVGNWPNQLDEITIVGHSMGGLVARSACLHGREAGHSWLNHLRRLVTIGTPHQGAPLERGSNWMDYAMDLSPYTAPFTRIGKKRSAGITDLRHGNIGDSSPASAALPDHVDFYAMAATLAKKRGSIHDRLIGDGLVPVDSALGRSKDPLRSLSVPGENQWLGFETGHLALLSDERVYKQLRDWLK